MPQRIPLSIIKRLVRLVDWLYGRNAAGIDVGLCAFAAGWASLMIERPALFDQGSYAGMTWLPDDVWIVVMSAVAIAHLVGVLRPAWINLRVGASLTSAWIWLFIAFSLARITITPGVITYSVIGMGSVFGAIYVAGSRQRAL